MEANNQSSQDIDGKYTKDDAYQSIGMINSWISNIDTKTSFALAFVGVLIGVIFNRGIPKAFATVTMVSRISELRGGDIIATILVALLYMVSFLSVCSFLLVMIARVKNVRNTQSVFFFGSIANQKLVDYQSRIGMISEKEIIEDLVEQIHTNSQICMKKIKYYKYGTYLLVITMILWFICEVFRLI